MEFLSKEDQCPAAGSGADLLASGEDNPGAEIT
jgi:hypothetical protein